MQKIKHLNEITLNTNIKFVMFECFDVLLKIQNKTNPYDYLESELHKKGIINYWYDSIYTDKNNILKIKELQKIHKDKIFQNIFLNFQQKLKIEISSLKVFPEVNKLLQDMARYGISTILFENTSQPYEMMIRKSTFPLNYYYFSYNIGEKLLYNHQIDFVCNKLKIDPQQILIVGKNFDNLNNINCSKVMIQR